MEKKEFKAGDCVVRIKESHLGMNIGDTARVKRGNDSWGAVELEEYEGTHDTANLQLVTLSSYSNTPIYDIY